MRTVPTKWFRSPARRIGVSVAALLLAVPALAAILPQGVVSPALASVHINLTSSVPANDSHVTVAPRELRLTFSGTVDVTRAKVALLGADGKPVALEPLLAVPDSSRVAVSKVAGTLVGGTYTVRWEAVASDGALGSGAFKFMYMPGAGHE